jgi:regulator of protease activity HflC (stomatin/prohibitin superfamily)
MEGIHLSYLWIAITVTLLALLFAWLALKVVKQYEQGVLFRLGRVIGVRKAGLTAIIPFVDVLHRVSLRIVTMPIQSQGIITRDNVSVDVSAVAYYRVVDAVKSVVAIENVATAINQIAQTTLRKVVGQHTLDETLSETDRINVNIREILDVATEEWGVVVTLVELKDIQLPDSMKRAMARQAEAEREKRAKIIAAEGEALAADALGTAADIMMAHPLALQLRNLQSLGRDRRRPQHHRRLPCPAHEHDRRTGSLSSPAKPTPPRGPPGPYPRPTLRPTEPGQRQRPRRTRPQLDRSDWWGLEATGRVLMSLRTLASSVR